MVDVLSKDIIGEKGEMSSHPQPKGEPRKRKSKLTLKRNQIAHRRHEKLRCSLRLMGDKEAVRLIREIIDEHIDGLIWKAYKVTDEKQIRLYTTILLVF